MRVTRVGRFALLVVAFVATASRVAEAEPFVCSSIQTGDTAWALARRLTGDAANRHQPWFQIVDPATQSFVPKSRYEVLSTRWRACVARDMSGSTAGTQVPISEPPVASQYDFDFGWRVGIAVASLLLACSTVKRYVVESRPVPDDLRQVGEAFVVAFARPLVQPFSVVPIEARLRFVPRLHTLEILIAPGKGRRYPNLSDHRKNLDYDIERVLRVLHNEFFLADRVRAEGRWVVIAIRRNADLKRQVPSEHSSPQFGWWWRQHPALVEGAVCDRRRPGAEERRQVC